MIPAVIRISQVAGSIHKIALEPPIAGMAPANLEASYSGAVGFAVEQASALRRTIIDETGRLKPCELELLCLGYSLDQLERIAKQLKPFAD